MNEQHERQAHAQEGSSSHEERDEQRGAAAWNSTARAAGWRQTAESDQPTTAEAAWAVAAVDEAGTDFGAMDCSKCTLAEERCEGLPITPRD